jgi:hypothetical protein
MIYPPIQSHKFNFIVKFALFTFLLFNSIQPFAQLNQFPCDSIKLKNGKILKATIIEKKKHKIRYFNNQKPGWKIRKIRYRRVDSIYYANQVNSFNRKDSLPYLQLSSWHSDGLSIRKITENSKLVIRTKDSLKLKGRLVIVNQDAVFLRLRNDPNFSPHLNLKLDSIGSMKLIPISNISSIQTTGKSVRVAGNIMGGLITLFGLYKYYSTGEVISIYLSIPFYAVNFRKKNYDLETKWKAEVNFKQNN